MNIDTPHLMTYLSGEYSDFPPAALTYNPFFGYSSVYLFYSTSTSFFFWYGTPGLHSIVILLIAPYGTLLQLYVLLYIKILHVKVVQVKVKASSCSSVWRLLCLNTVMLTLYIIPHLVINSINDVAAGPEFSHLQGMSVLLLV